MQLKPCASINNECQVQHVVWLGRVLVARGGTCPVQDGLEGGGNINNRCWLMLLFYSVARVISQLLTISIWTEIASPGTEQKGKVFLEEGNGGFGNTWNVTSLWGDLGMWRRFKTLRQLSILKLWTEWKDAKSAPSRDISDECVIAEKSRWRKRTHLILSHNIDDSHKCAFLMLITYAYNSS